MLPRAHRLTRSSDFARVRRLGRTAATNNLALHVLERPGDEIRVGFSVSKRVGKATQRNRVKRLLREAVRSELHAIRSGQDLVFSARPAAAELQYPGIAQDVGYLLARTQSRLQPAIRAGSA